MRALMIGQRLGTRWMAARPDARMYSASAESRPFSAESRTRRSAISTLSAASAGNTVALIGSSLLFASASSAREPAPPGPTKPCAFVCSSVAERDQIVKRRHVRPPVVGAPPTRGRAFGPQGDRSNGDPATVPFGRLGRQRERDVFAITLRA